MGLANLIDGTRIDKPWGQFQPTLRRLWLGKLSFLHFEESNIENPKSKIQVIPCETLWSGLQMAVLW